MKFLLKKNEKTAVAFISVILFCTLFILNVFAATVTVGDLVFSLTPSNNAVRRGEYVDVSIDISGTLTAKGVFVITSGIYYDPAVFVPEKVGGKYPAAGSIVPAAGLIYLTGDDANDGGRKYVSVNYGLSEDTSIHSTGTLATLRFRVKDTAPNGIYNFSLFKTGGVSYVANNGNVEKYNTVLNNVDVRIVSPFTVNVPGSVYKGEDLVITGTSEVSALSVDITGPGRANVHSGTIAAINGQYTYAFTIPEDAVTGEYDVIIRDAYSTERRITTVLSVPTVPIPTPVPPDEGGVGEGTGGTTGGGGGAITPSRTPIPRPTSEPPDYPPPGTVEYHAAYMKGYVNGTLQIENNITRQEIAMILFRISEDPDKENYNIGISPFTDVNTDRWSFQAIMYMYKMGIVTGYDDNTFRPERAITRAEFTKMVCLFKGLEAKYSDRFLDVDASNWAYGYVAAVTDKGWILGYPEGDFGPDRNLTRAETAAIVNRMLLRRMSISAVPEDVYLLDVPREHWAFTDMILATTSHYSQRKEDGWEEWIK